MEFLDIINEHDEVIGSAPRDEIYEKRLSHRIAHLIVYNDAGEMALQLRGKTSYRPDFWVTTAGGHVQSGESYEEAAIREAQEETNFTPTMLSLLGKTDFFVEDQHILKKLAIFTTTYNGPLHPDPVAVQRIEFFSLDNIRHMIQTGEKLHPELLFILKHYYDIE